MFKKFSSKLTRANAVWFMKTTVLSWVIQGVIYGLLLALGMGAIQSIVTAKSSAWAVWLVQCVRAAKS